MTPLKQLEDVLKEAIARILTERAPRSLNYKQIIKYLELESGKRVDLERDEFIELLDTMVFEKKLLVDNKFRYTVKPAQKILEGLIEFTQKGSAYLIVEGLEDDLFIPAGKTANALNGDLVRVTQSASGRNKRDAEVVEVLSRSKTGYAGVLQVTPKFAFLIPDDPKMPTDIFIPLPSLGKAQNGEKVVAEIVDWKRGEKNPIGTIKAILGMPGENDTEMNAILSEYGFPLKFPASVEREAANIKLKIPEEAIAGRRDFRGITTFTIDPADAKDFDDALSFQILPNGNIEVGVHIADVSYFLREGTEMEKEAYDRATSVYLVDRVIPMLPEKLSNEVCSLRPNEDKLCFSAVFELNDMAEIINEWFGRTIIHSIKRFSYEQAQDVIEGTSIELKDVILKLDALAKLMRGQRFKLGAISFEKSEVKFRLDEKGNPIGVYVKENKDSNKLIEEFMLLANKRVAEFVGKKSGQRKTFIYRVHDVPVADRISAFSDFAAKFGYKVQTGSDKEIAHSLNKLLKDVSGKKEQNVLELLAIRTMAKAIYTTENIGHYGLAFDYYSHFTSPIRRYPDVMVHRLLQDYLDDKKSPDSKAFETRCKHSTEMEIRASSAERDSVKFKQVQFLKSRVGEVFDGIISGVTEWGVFVEIVENKCEGMIRLRDMKDDYYSFDEKNFCIVGRKKRKKFQLGDSVKVRVARADLLKRQVDMELVTSV